MDLSESQILTKRQDCLHGSIFLSLGCLKVLLLQYYCIWYYGNHSLSADTAIQTRTSLPHKTQHQWHKLQELQRYLSDCLSRSKFGFCFNNQLLRNVTSKPQQNKKCSQNSGTVRQDMSTEWHSEFMPERDVVESNLAKRQQQHKPDKGCIAYKVSKVLSQS